MTGIVNSDPVQSDEIKVLLSKNLCNSTTQDTCSSKDDKCCLESSNCSSEQSSNSKLDKTSPKSCPYKYWVITACFFNVMFCLGVNRSLLIYLTNFQKTFDTSEKMKAMFFVLPMIFGGLCAPFAAVLTKKFGARIICTLFSFLGTCAWLAGVHFGQNTDEEGLKELASEFQGNCTYRGDVQEDVTVCILKGKLYKFLACIAVAGLFHGGVLVNAPIEVNRWVGKDERGFWNSVVVRV